MRVLCSERDHAASLTAQKVPVAFHSTTDPSCISYMQHLIPYVYKFIAKQMALKTKVQLVNDVASNSVSLLVKALYQSVQAHVSAHLGNR